MKKKILLTVGIILVLVSLGLTSLPFVGNYLNSMNADSSIVNYLESAQSLDNEMYNNLREQAESYNKNLLNNQVLEDPFSADVNSDDEYKKLLLINKSDVMATLEIPSLELNLPVYHGTDKKTLEKGIGHLPVSSLPIGGKGTHSVLTGHTGYSVFRLFSDLDKLEIDDVFFINTLGDRLAYKIDSINIVEPSDTKLLQIDPDKDYVTLITCTPFGVNSHRLLVRGVRTELTDPAITADNTHISDSTWQREYKTAIILGITVMLAILVVFGFIKLILFIVRKRKNKNA